MIKVNVIRIIGFVTSITVFLCQFANASNLEDLIFIEGTSINTFVSGGNVDTLENSPSDASGNLKLLSSTIGSPFPNTVGWVAPNGPVGQRSADESLVNEGLVHVISLKKLFNDYYNNGEPETPNSMYLAYDFFLYDAVSDQVQFTPNGGDTSGTSFVPANLFDPSKSEKAKEALFTALQINPYITTTIDNKPVFVANLLLDVAYYESVSYIMKGNLALEKAYSYRFVGSALANNTQPIFNELKELGWDSDNNVFFEDEGAWGNFLKAGRVWVNLLKSPLQRGMLQEWAASRDLDYLSHPAFIAGNQTAEPEVYDGFKDAAAIYKILAQRAKILSDVAGKLVLTLKRDEASELISEVVSQLIIEEAYWYNFFFSKENDKDENGDGSIDVMLPEGYEAKYPGLANSIFEFKGNLTRASSLRLAALNDDLNALGFDKNVLYINNNLNDSLDSTYDWFKTTLLDQDIAKGILKLSIDQDTVALNTRKNFLHNAADYQTQFSNIKNEYESQLIELAGIDDSSSELKPNLDNPQTGGGLIEQQIDNIEVANNEIQKIKLQMQNIISSVDIERERALKNKEVSDKKIKMINSKGAEVGQLQKQISYIQGDMAFASGMAAAAAAAVNSTQGLNVVTNTLTLGSQSVLNFGIHATNAVIQRELNQQIGRKQKAIARIQTEKEAKFVYFTQSVEANNSAALIQNKFLDIRVLQIDLLNSQIRLGQEVDRLAGFYTKMNMLRSQMNGAQNRLLQKNAIDPIYRIEVTKSAIEADETFKQAQLWSYLMIRALEYKWPLYTEGKDSSINSYKADVIKARTAEQLKTKASAMASFYDDVNESKPTPNTYYSSFSLKEDYLGFDIGSSASEATNKFVNHLQSMISDANNIIELSSGDRYLGIDFSTVKFNSRFNFENQETVTIKNSDESTSTSVAKPEPVFSGELWDNKIVNVQVNIDGNNVYGLDTEQMPTQLWYGGTSFVRTQNGECVSTLLDNGTTESHLLDYRDYSKPAYEFDLRDGSYVTWVAKEFIKAQVTAKLVSKPRNTPDSIFQTNSFRERPVAASGWKILLPLEGLKIQNIRDIEISIISKARTIDHDLRPTCQL